uniref:Uncharacterized protein n=1 Tax=viral metagenome TaxID=1070528 RepID=A0A6C0BBA7_9ZZZZ
MHYIHKALYHIQNNAFTLFIILSYISYIGLAIGIQIVSPDSLNKLDYYAKIYVSLFLLYRFNVFNKIKFNDLDRKIAFSAGIFLITTTIINDIIQKYAKVLLNFIDL